MNLGKLLGAGKSLINWRAGKTYNKSRRAYLPKFNAENPFEPKAAASAPVAEPKVVKPAAAKASAVSLSKPVVKSVAKPTRATTWTQKLNPFRPPAPVAPPTYKAVQTELSLAAVRPVSNDLSDADIEVVPVKSRTVTAVDLTELPMLPPTRKSWEFVGERLMEQA